MTMATNSNEPAWDIPRWRILTRAHQVGIVASPDVTWDQLAESIEEHCRTMGCAITIVRHDNDQQMRRALLGAIALVPVRWPETGEIISQEESWRRFYASLDAEMRKRGMKIVRYGSE